MIKEENWFVINNVDQIDSPALVIYIERVKKNIRTLVSMINDVSRLRPHIKTHKSKEAVELCMEAGIRKFKCATIAEAELLALCKAPDVLMAYQPAGPKLNRLLDLVEEYPGTAFSCLIDNHASATLIAAKAAARNISLFVFLDLNIGMNRTGIIPGREAFELYQACKAMEGISIRGLHAYDGHIHTSDLEIRTRECEQAYRQVDELKNMLVQAGYGKPVIIAGGTPCFPVHVKRKEVECSPGTFIFWDKGYQDAYPDQPFVPAALVISRVISMPGISTLCLDLGHKSVASENDLPHRVFFLNAPDLTLLGHSEEHLVVEAGTGHHWKIGDVLYGLPVHICPTCALYDSATIVEQGNAHGTWEIVARDRKLSY